jgi:N-acetylmuramoyl-L-alanine amidase
MRRTLGAAFLLLLALLYSLLPAAPLVEIYNLRYHTHPNFTRIVIDVSSVREYTSAELRNPGRIFVDVFEAKLNPLLQGKTILIKNDYLSEIRIAQKTTTSVRVVADVELEKIRNYRVWHLLDPFRIVIDIYPSGAPAEPQPKPAVSKPAEPARSGYSLARQLGLGIKSVVIDPGHGGNDPGCVRKDGLKEKEIALDISERLAALLQKDGLEVIMTRETDIYVPLENRTVVANQKKADLFVSIHVNSNRNKKRRGIETFYLNFSTDSAVNEVAARENATTTKTIGDMQEIIKKIIQNSKIVESRELALQIQKNLVNCVASKYSNIKNLGAKGGPFWVLIGGEMPSALIEVSHLSNDSDALLLKSPIYRQSLAQGIFEGVREYIKSLGKG